MLLLRSLRVAQPQLRHVRVQRRLFAGAAAATPTELRKTALYDLHLKHGAKMVPFGDYAMPVQYEGQGVGESHLWVREKCGLFDVGHMVQHLFSGPTSPLFLSLITPSSPSSLSPHASTLSTLQLRSGGIQDDTIITHLPLSPFPALQSPGPYYHLVTNATRRAADLAYIRTHLSDFFARTGKVAPVHTNLSSLGFGLLALQGPRAAEVLASVLRFSGPASRLETLYFGQSRYVDVSLPSGQSFRILVSRGGYTGEDGFEISVPTPADTVAIAEFLLSGTREARENVRLAGLGARDSLRLEAGLCLYGHDIDESTTPAEAGLGWVVGKERREEGGFEGAETVLAQLRKKSEGGSPPSRKRVGLVLKGGPPAREGAEIVDPENPDQVIGNVTSGCPSPSLGKGVNVAMGYVPTQGGWTKSGKKVGVVVRGKVREAEVTKMPFVEVRYWREPKE